MNILVTGAAGFIGSDGISVPARAMLDAVHKAADGRTLGKVSFDPDPAAQALMDSVARSTFSARAERLGFRHSASIEEIVSEYLKGRTP